MSFNISLANLFLPGSDEEPGKELERKLVALYSEEDGRFHVLAKAAGLDPEVDFQRCDLRRLDFLDADLRGYDFTGSDLRGTRLRAANLDDTTRLVGALIDREDASWLEEVFGDRPSSESPLMADLRRSVRQGQIDVLYQPIVNFKNRTIERVEALVRWVHPEHGSIAPAVFIPMLEQAGLLDTLTFSVIERAIEDQRVIRAAGYDLRIAVNIPPASLGDIDFVENCCRILSGQSAALRFEVPDSVVVFTSKSLTKHTEQLQSFGVDFALDDYGTGFSSLGALRNFPAVELKIDRSLTVNIDSDGKSPSVVRSTIDLGHALGMTVTAEGVEAATTASLLEVMGCDAVQGFHISRSLTLDALIDFLKISPLLTGSADTRAFPRMNLLAWNENDKSAS